MMRLLLVMLALGSFARAALADEVRRIPRCSHAALHAGTCVEALPGRLARIVDANGKGSDPCDPASGGGGRERALCRYGQGAWSAVGAPRNVASGFALASASLRVLDISNPPPGSGLVPPAADGIDGEPQAPRTDDAGAINAAIQFACDNDYDIAYLGPGVYRIGAPDTGASFYSGIRIDASLCPGGIRFYGAGVGRTVLLVNGEQGQYVVYTTDQWTNATRLQRIGWSTFGGEGDGMVTSVTTGVTPPVVTGSDDSLLEDGDTVHIRNCAGATAMNERRFKVANCTDEAPFSCALQDEQGVDIDASDWAPWNASTQCIVTKLNTEFETEIAYMTIRDDDPYLHQLECNPTCMPAREESHGIGILQGGGRVEVHHLVIDGIGDEAIDVSAPESPSYVHDVTILDPEVSAVSIYQGVGIRVEDVLVYSGTPWAQFLGAFPSLEAVTADPGAKSWRIVDLHVNRTVAIGLFRYGMAFSTNSTGRDGSYVSGVVVSNSAVSLETPPFLCAGTGVTCGSIRVIARPDDFPMEDVEISDNWLVGTVYANVELGAGGVLLSNNTLSPIPNIDPKWGIETTSIDATIEDNDISGFGRGCIKYADYLTGGGSNATVTTSIERNLLACVSNASDLDAMIDSQIFHGLPPAPQDAGYLRILDNQISVTPGSWIKEGIVSQAMGKNVEICGNTIDVDPSVQIAGATGVFSEVDEAVVCDNVIAIQGTGVAAKGDGSHVIDNQLDGNGGVLARGVVITNASNVLVSGNELSDYATPSAVGIEVTTETAPQSSVRIVGNQLGGSGVGIEVDGAGFGLQDVTVARNTVDMQGIASGQAVRLHDTAQSQVLRNWLLGLTGAGVDALLTSGSTDYITVRDNVAEGGGTLKFGTTGGDASCDPTGGVGANSTCADNTLQ